MSIWAEIAIVVGTVYVFGALASVGFGAAVRKGADGWGRSARQRQDERALGARMILGSPVWPMMLALAIRDWIAVLIEDASRGEN